MAKFERKQIDWGLKTVEHGQLKNTCNDAFSEELHAENCDGSCERIPAKDVEVDMHNEIVEWNKMDRVIQGVPDAMAGGPFGGIPVDILQSAYRIEALVKFLVEKGMIDKEEVTDFYKDFMTRKIRTIRQRYQEAQAAEKIAVATPRIILPGGNGGEIKH